MPGSSCLQRCATLPSLLSTQWERLAPLQLLSIVWRGGAVLRDFFFFDGASLFSALPFFFLLLSATEFLLYLLCAQLPYAETVLL